MNQRNAFVIYSNRHKKYYQTTQFNMPTWTKNIQDSYWFLSKEKAQNCINTFIKQECAIIECTIYYPEGIEVYIKINKL